MTDRRRFITIGALGAACACVGGLAFAQAPSTPPTSPTGKWICPPCGCDSDGKTFDVAGICPSDGCGMTLVPKPEDPPKPS